MENTNFKAELEMPKLENFDHTERNRDRDLKIQKLQSAIQVL